MNPAPKITRPEDAESIWVIRDRLRFMGVLEGTQLEVVEIDVPPGGGVPPHTHASPVIFRVLSGEVTFGTFPGGQPVQSVAGPGTVVTVPSGVPHFYVNASGAPASLLVVLERPMIDFFRDVGRHEPPPAGPPSEAEIAHIAATCARHGITLLAGPPPR